MNSIRLLELTLEIESIVIGERFKGGTFRPCQETIPSSTIEGALKRYFGIEVPAVGFFEEKTYEIDEFTYSVRDRFLNVSKLPITTAYLKSRDPNRKIKAKVYIPYSKGAILKELPKNREFRMGALKSKGFGNSKIVEILEVESQVKQGILKVKIFSEEAGEFGIESVAPVYGFLFKPDKFSVEGVYKRALFPGSLVRAPVVFLKEVTYYDEQNRGCI